jgi:hypothetical protein
VLEALDRLLYRTTAHHKGLGPASTLKTDQYNAGPAGYVQRPSADIFNVMADVLQHKCKRMLYRTLSNYFTDEWHGIAARLVFQWVLY